MIIQVLHKLIVDAGYKAGISEIDGDDEYKIFLFLNATDEGYEFLTLYLNGGEIDIHFPYADSPENYTISVDLSLPNSIDIILQHIKNAHK